MQRMFVTLLLCALASSNQAQEVSQVASEFAVLRTDRVIVTAGEGTHLNCSVTGMGDTAQISCESHSGSGIPLVYHIALVVGSNHVGYVVSCGGGLVRRIGCQPLSAGQVLRGSVDGDKLHVSMGGKTKTYRIETSAYIGPLGKGSPDESTSATPPSAAPTGTEPTVKFAAHTQKSERSNSGAEQADETSSPKSSSSAKVMVSSEPTGGDIYIDGNFVGNTPSLIDLPAGSHTVKVEVKGQMQWSRTVSLTAGSKVTLQAVLDAAK